MTIVITPRSLLIFAAAVGLAVFLFFAGASFEKGSVGPSSENSVVASPAEAKIEKVRHDAGKDYLTEANTAIALATNEPVRPFFRDQLLAHVYLMLGQPDKELWGILGASEEAIVATLLLEGPEEAARISKFGSNPASIWGVITNAQLGKDTSEIIPSDTIERWEEFAGVQPFGAIEGKLLFARKRTYSQLVDRLEEVLDSDYSLKSKYEIQLSFYLGLWQLAYGDRQTAISHFRDTATGEAGDDHPDEQVYAILWLRKLSAE